MSKPSTATDCSRLQARLRDMLTFANADGLGPFCGRDVQELIDAFASIPSSTASNMEIGELILRIERLLEGHWTQNPGWQDVVTAFHDAIRALTLPSASATPTDAISMPKAWIEAAKCPNCGGQGWKAVQVAAGEWEQEQCQWCFEQWQALGQPAHTDIEQSSG